MASITSSSVSFKVSCSLKQNQVSKVKKVSLSFSGKSFPSLKLQPLRFRVACAAQPETVDKVCEIVRKQLALPAGFCCHWRVEVEIVMGLEEEFGISVEEESAQSITTVQEAADMIENLKAKKA
ncbi:Acyl carrier protein 3 [Abeliophyllum distichum]|uniref:Acyl carrier protein 3 n=1 Tax=Abeliophyllum distichum TaxID=126358 RepID=A0ABD1T1X0_9LAMI